MYKFFSTWFWIVEKSLKFWAAKYKKSLHPTHSSAGGLYRIIFMSFCRILSTLCSLVVFYNVPHFSRGRQKSGTKSTAYNRRSGTKCKTPLLFVPLFWNNMRQKVTKTINAPLILKMRDIIIKCGIRMERYCSRGRDERGRMWIDFSLFKPNLKNM